MARRADISRSAVISLWFSVEAFRPDLTRGAVLLLLSTTTAAALTSLVATCPAVTSTLGLWDHSSPMTVRDFEISGTLFGEGEVPFEHRSSFFPIRSCAR
ncbi:MAG: hypothetical protein NVS9B15_11650 [Acidobacteriaceae bacterium]